MLEGLQCTLHKERGRWDMAFCEDPHAALELLATMPTDVLVSDLHMPSMQGAELLEQARTRAPATLRLALSGNADEAQTLRSIPFTHQWLSKPCDRAVLVAALERACSIKSILDDPGLRKLTGEVATLPSLPRLYESLMIALRDPEASVDEVAALVEQDPAMSAKFLQIANSAFFALPREIPSVHGAISLLGFRTVAQVVLASEALEALRPDQEILGYPFRVFQASALATSRVAAAIMEDLELPPESASTAGLLHDIGLLVLAGAHHATLFDPLRLAKVRKAPLWKVEQRNLGTTHAEVGAAVLGLWGLPAEVVEAVARHHRPTEASSPEFGVVGAVHVAAALTDAALARATGRSLGVPDRVDVGYLDGLGLLPKLETWTERAAAEVDAQQDDPQAAA